MGGLTFTRAKNAWHNSRMSLRRTLVSFTLLAALAGCAKAPPPAKEYVLTGVVLKLDPAGQLVTVKGDKIEGWMEAMTMDYPVKDKREFQKLKAGDNVSAKVMVQGTEYWLGELTDTASPAAK